MHYILLGITAFLIGFIAAIPVSASQLEVAKRAIQGYIASAVLLIVGGTVSDLFYGVIAFFGIRSFLRHPLVEAIFWLANAGILITLGIYTIRHGNNRQGIDEKEHKSLSDKRVAIATGFTLSIMNPLMISWWLIGAKLAEDFGIFWQAETSTNLTFLISGAIGLASYSVLLIFVFNRWKHTLSPETVRRITFWFGIALLVLAGYFLVRSSTTLYKLKFKSHAENIAPCPGYENLYAAIPIR